MPARQTLFTLQPDLSLDSVSGALRWTRTLRARSSFFIVDRGANYFALTPTVAAISGVGMKAFRKSTTKRTYTVKASENLSDWATVPSGNVTNVAGGPFSSPPRAGKNFSQRFYRAVLQP